MIEGFNRLPQDIQTVSVSSQFRSHEVVIIIDISVLSVGDKSELEQSLFGFTCRQGSSETREEHDP